jgi:hypothetical protein
LQWNRLGACSRAIQSDSQRIDRFRTPLEKMLIVDSHPISRFRLLACRLGDLSLCQRVGCCVLGPEGANYGPAFLALT